MTTAPPNPKSAMASTAAGHFLRLAAAATTAASGYIHAQLYVSGYRFIHAVGILFLLQAAASFAIAALLLIGGPAWLRLLAAGAAIGALTGFAASRTIGVFGFTERGFQPAPKALLSVLAEVATLLFLTPALIEVSQEVLRYGRHHREKPRRVSLRT